MNKVGESNYSYFPIIFDTEERLLNIEKVLNFENIFPRRYFYPSVNTFTNIVTYSSTPISEDISKRILCLPLYWKLEKFIMEKIISIIKTN